MADCELQTPVNFPTISIDLEIYQDEQHLQEENKKMILNEIERTKKSHE